MKRVVIVEDEYRIREGLKRLIEKLNMGCTVVGEAENGLEGLKMIQILNPDIVFMDIQMPKLSGLEVIKKVAELNLADRCEFVILSGYADFAYAQEAISMGVKEYLLKPVTISDIKTILCKLCQEEKRELMPIDMQESAKSPAVINMLDAITKEYGKQLRLDGFAEEYHMTPQYLSNLFSGEIGMTFSDYLKKVRMEKAKELIKQGKLKIYLIACSVGYPDQKYFSKVFKDYTGLSPKQFAVEEGGKNH